MSDFYKKIVEGAREAFVVIREGRVEYINRYGAGEIGHSPSDMIGKDFLLFVDEGSQKDVLKNYHKTMEGVIAAPYIAKFKKKDGGVITAEVYSQRIEYQGGFADLAIIKNIEARIKIEKVFREQADRFYNLSQNTPDIIARFDEDFRYIYINEALAATFNISPDSVFWKSNEDLGINEESFPINKTHIQTVVKEKEVKSFYSSTTDGKDKKYYYITLVPEFFDDGSVKSVLAIVRDITEIKEIDQIKSDFIAIATHQLRSPLSVINWSTLVMLKDDVSPEEQKEYLEKIHDSARELIKITDTFLSATIFDLEIFVFNHRMTNVVSVAEEVFSSLQKTVSKKNISLRKNYPSSAIIKFDERALKIMIKTLISNAVDYSEDGGVVVFSISTSSSELIISVTDNGIGVSPKEQQRVFDRFYRSTTAKSVKTYGTGLDLYIIKSLVGKAGGRIRVISPPSSFEKGTTFLIKIPLCEQ